MDYPLTSKRLQKLTVASTFTSDPIAESLEYWAGKFGFEASIRFSPYDQIFQELVNPGSVLNDPESEARIVFLKIDDWIRNFDSIAKKDSESSLIESNIKMLCDYAEFAASAVKSPLFIFVTPNKPGSRISDEQQQGYQKAISEKLSSVSNVYVVLPGEVQKFYPVRDYYDSQRDQLGHIPYSRDYFAALGSSVFRKVMAATRKPYKVIVLDCDNTLWGGVCGEVGPKGIELSDPFLKLQRFMLDQIKTGKILCLCSKNVEEDVDRVFAERPDMIITKDDIVGSKVNWESKSKNIRELAEELSLGLDSFIFVDDNPVECAEVRAACPEVLSLNLPSNTDEFEKFLNHVWPFDALSATAEDKKRTELYKDNLKRASFKSSSSSLQDFIEGLNLKVDIKDASEDEISRVSQLTYRTNQFNFTTIRRSEEEIKSLFKSGNCVCKTCRVTDRFGDYGLVGVMLYFYESDKVVLDSFMLSCRVLGRSVEHQMLKSVGMAAKESGKSDVQINFNHTEKNKPALNFLSSVFDDFVARLDSEGTYVCDAETLIKLSFKADTDASETKSEAKTGKVTSAEKSDETNNNAITEYVAKKLNSTESVVASIAEQRKSAKSTSSESQNPAETDSLNQITNIWKDVLDAENIGPDEHFFDIGGTSLKAVEVLSQLNEQFGKQLTIVSLFEHSTIRGLAGLIDEKPESEAKSKVSPSSASQEQSRSNTDIAIVGMAGRFPKAKNVTEFWENLVQGRECFTELTDEQIIASGVDPELVKDPDYVKVSPVLEDYDKFDAHFFGYTPREVSMMDPQQRLFLECCWEAFEDAGYNPHEYEAPVGVFGGCAINSYMVFSGVHKRFYSEFLPSVVGNDNSFLANRVSYQLNLNGPAVSVQTACSTGLVSVHLSIQSLLSGECDMALAGGVAVWVPHEAGHLHKEGSVFTKDGHCRAFDAKATGTIFGNGSAVVLLKRYDDAVSDGDTIYAVIKSSAMNNDGAKKTDYTAPSVDGQTEVVKAALDKAGISADDISYVETHGTGTFIGDPIEIRALTKAYRTYTDRKGFCGIGSVKPNIGHLDAGAGTAGLIKTIMALRHRQIPPSINYDEPNPALDIENTPFYVNDKLRKWESPNGGPLLAGVTSLGMGGTNAHVIVQEAPVIERPVVKDQWPLLLSWSAKKNGALDDYASKLADFLKTNPEASLPNVTYTLQKGRKNFNQRRYLVAESREDAIEKLEKLSAVHVKTFSDQKDGREVVFMFPGQASQYVNMGKDLYENDATFRTYFDRCADLLLPHTGIDIRDIIYPAAQNDESAAAEKLKNTVYTQPSIFAIEYALAMMWMELGIKPAAVIGHSMGELTAACIAGVLDLETGLQLIAMRGKIMQELEPGSMLSVMLSPVDVEEYLNDRLSVSVINTPNSCVISGDDEVIKELKAKFDTSEITSRILETSHAFHSHMMDPVLEKYRDFASGMKLSEPDMPIISTVTADWVAAGEMSSPEYWASNIRQPVRFSEAVEKLFEKPNWILMEVGPGNTLSTLSRQHPDAPEDQVAIPVMRHPKQDQNDQSFALGALGRLWSCGYDVDWSRLYGDNPVYRIPIPTYAFQRIRCWLDPETNGYAGSLNGVSEEQLDTESDSNEPAKSLSEELREIWEEFLGVENIKPEDNFFELGGNSLVAVQLFDEIKRKLDVKLPLSTLFQAPTIAEISKVIEPLLPEEKKQAKSPQGDITKKPSHQKHASVLVKIQGEGDGRPFFCIHGHFGNVLFFHELAQLLGKDRPFYGVQSAGLSGEEDPLTSIEDMADRILTEMREVQPEGPYSFGGYCYGTLISREIVRKLDAMGETYDPIVMIDPHPPAYVNVLEKNVLSSFQKFSINQRKQKHGAEISKRSVTDSLKYLAEKVSWRLRFTSKVKSLNAFIKLSRMRKFNMPSVFRDVELCNRVAHDNYVKNLSDDFNADVELLIPKQISESYAQAPDYGWKGFTRGKMNIHLIEDDGQIMSGEMFKKPYVKKTADVVKSIWNMEAKKAPLNNKTALNTANNEESKELVDVT